MIKLEDLEPELRTFLTSMGRHPRIAIGFGAKTVFLYVPNRQLKKQVESQIPGEYRAWVQVVLTGGIRPASAAKRKSGRA